MQILDCQLPQTKNDDLSLEKQFEREFQNPKQLIINKQAEIKEYQQYRQILEKAKKVIFQLNLIQRKQLEEFKIVSDEYHKERANNKNLLDQLHQKIIKLEEDKQKNQRENQNLILQLTKQTEEKEEEKNKLQESLVQVIKKLEIENKTLSLSVISAMEKSKQLEKQSKVQNQLTNLPEQITKPLKKKQQQTKKVNQQKIEKIIEQQGMPQQIIKQKQFQKEEQFINNQIELQKELSYKNIDQILNNSSNLRNRPIDIEKQENEIKKTNENLQKIELNQDTVIIQNPNMIYVLQTEYSLKQSEYCKAIAFNQKQNVMIAGCGSKIVVFDFNHGKLKFQQILDDHTVGIYICTLYFMKKQNQFISGTTDQIGIWNYNNFQEKWYCQQLIKQAHYDDVNRVIMNNSENLIISCSSDSTIKFWIKEFEWYCSQTLRNHQRSIHNICLNQSCTQLVSCDRNNIILISQIGIDNTWQVIQEIKVDQWGYRLCFINDEVITFQPENAKKMEIYYFNKQSNQFEKFKEVEVENDRVCHYWFPQVFSMEKQILLNKNGSRVILIEKKNNDFFVKQSIGFGGYNVFGALTDDGEYLVTWDAYSYEFQVRKHK